MTVLFLTVPVMGTFLYIMPGYIQAKETGGQQDTAFASGVDWTIDDDGTLVIVSDKGMEDWTSSRGSYKSYVMKAVIENDVTIIENCAFEDCRNMEMCLYILQ